MIREILGNNASEATQKSEAEYKLSQEERQQLEELERPIQIILNKLRSRIERGEYNFVLGDDASGRIPALIVGDVLKNVYKNKGFPSPPIRFIAGSTGLWNEADDARKYKKQAVRDQIRNIKDEILGLEAKKALIVTDIVGSGQSVSVLCNPSHSQILPKEVRLISLLE